MSFPSRSFFVYLNIDVFPAAWAAYRGQLITPSNYGTPTFRPFSYWPVGLLRDRRILRLQKELELERIRRQSYPTQVSRLHGIYLWGDEESAKRGERWRENEGNHYHPDYLVEVGFTYSRLSRVDTNWIDKCLLPDSVPLDRTDPAWMHSYWKGEPRHDMEPLWEYIAEGRGVVYGTALRMKAYEIVKRHAPESLGQLELGRIAVQLGSDLHHIAPFILRVSQTRFRVDYFGDERDQNDEFMTASGNYIQQIAQKDRSQTNFEALNLLQGDTRRADLRHLGFEIDCKNFQVDEQTFVDAFVSQHDGSIWHGLTDPPHAKLVQSSTLTR